VQLAVNRYGVEAVNLPAIRITIELAKHYEAETAHMRNALAQRLPLLHAAIKLPAQQPLAALLDFVTTYIEQVPNCLEIARAVSNAAHIDEQTKPLLQLAADYFLKPSELTGGQVGLDELMNEAYLAHRLLEEVNDHYRTSLGIPLLPVDLTAANLIGHHLIGEPFANELDEAVLYSVEQLLHRQARIGTPALNNRGAKFWEREFWPCLTRQLSINLQFSA
jgi:hypothetical protein